MPLRTVPGWVRHAASGDDDALRGKGPVPAQQPSPVQASRTCRWWVGWPIWAGLLRFSWCVRAFALRKSHAAVKPLTSSRHWHPKLTLLFPPSFLPPSPHIANLIVASPLSPLFSFSVNSHFGHPSLFSGPLHSFGFTVLPDFAFCPSLDDSHSFDP